jgi:diadenosine tetraphosphate (Ap4A) HIT family hydrolase
MAADDVSGLLQRSLDGPDRIRIDQMTCACSFCEPGPDIRKRVFYERPDWYAFLAAPPYAKGHTILARQKAGAECPTALLREHLRGTDQALPDVVEAIRSHYSPKPKDVLVASLRGKEPHVHWHLIPLWEEQERAWRLGSRHERGHLFEFLADADRTAQSKALDERIKHGWTAKEQRDHFTVALQSDVNALSRLCPHDA